MTGVGFCSGKDMTCAYVLGLTSIGVVSNHGDRQAPVRQNLVRKNLYYRAESKKYGTVGVI